MFVEYVLSFYLTIDIPAVPICISSKVWYPNYFLLEVLY